MNGYSPENYYNGTPAISGIVTNKQVCRDFPITAGGSLNIAIKIVVSGVTQVGTLTAKLQTAIGADWVDSKSATFTADGAVYIKLNVQVSGDQTYLPLLSKGRVVITTTNAGDALTVSEVSVLQNL